MMKELLFEYGPILGAAIAFSTFMFIFDLLVVPRWRRYLASRPTKYVVKGPGGKTTFTVPPGTSDEELERIVKEAIEKK